MDILLQSLTSLIKQAEAVKLFDHCYFECGNLSQRDPKMVYKSFAQKEAIFDLSSLTKALVTTPLIFDFVKKKGIGLESVVRDWLGDHSYQLNDKILDLRISKLLSHMSGLPAWRNFFSKCTEAGKPQSIVDALNRCSVDSEKDCYSDLGYLLLGMCLEKISQLSLRDLFVQFRPQGFETLTDRPKMSGYCVSTGFSAIRGRELVGEVHDDNAYSLGGFPGHAGLFGTGEAVSGYLRYLWNENSEMVSKNAQAIVLGKSNASLFGFRQGDDESGRAFFEGATMGHYGFSGTAFWIEPNSAAYVILLTNRVKFAFVPGQNWRIFRKRVFEIAEKVCKGA